MLPGGRSTLSSASGLLRNASARTRDAAVKMIMSSRFVSTPFRRSSRYLTRPASGLTAGGVEQPSLILSLLQVDSGGRVRSGLIRAIVPS
jgi:hypothetical protein